MREVLSWPAERERLWQKGRGYSGLGVCYGRMHGNEWEKQKVNQDRAGPNRRKCDSQQRKGQPCLQKQRVND